MTDSFFLFHPWLPLKHPWIHFHAILVLRLFVSFFGYEVFLNSLAVGQHFACGCKSFTHTFLNLLVGFGFQIIFFSSHAVNIRCGLLCVFLYVHAYEWMVGLACSMFWSLWLIDSLSHETPKKNVKKAIPTNPPLLVHVYLFLKTIWYWKMWNMKVGSFVT